MLAAAWLPARANFHAAPAHPSSRDFDLNMVGLLNVDLKAVTERGLVIVMIVE